MPGNVPENESDLKTRRRPAPRGHRARKLDAWLLQAVDGGLAGAIFIVPLLMGGRHALGQLALVVLAVATASAWTLRQCLRSEATWRPVWPALLLVAGAVLLVVQIVPLPPAVLKAVAPHTAEILPLWNSPEESAARLGPWQNISLTPAATRAALVLLLAYGLLFVVTVQRIHAVEDVERLLRCCALSAVLMAAFGLVQLLTSNGKFFWFYAHLFSTTRGVAKGSFTNKNHFAQFLALGIGPLIWWLQETLRRARGGQTAAAETPVPARHARPLAANLLALALAVTLLAGLLSLSRGGVAIMFLAAGICTAVCYRASSVGKRFVISLAAAGLLIGGALAIFGYDRVSDRLSDLSSGSLERLDRSSGRRAIWAAIAHAVPQFPLFGSGVGSMREVYPMYLQSPPVEGIEYTHAENCYLQVALETGATGLALILSGIGWCACWCVAGLRSAVPTRLKVCTGAVAGSLAAAAAHALVDFVWYVPACVAIVAILAACALRLRQLGASAAGKARLPAVRRPVALAAAVVVLLAGFWMIEGRIGPAVAESLWDQYQIAKTASQVEAGEVSQGTSRRAHAARMALRERQEKLIAALEQVVRWQPDHARAHLELAECYLRLFDLAQMSAENAMSLGNVRDAAMQSQFASREALDDWMARAVGDQRAHLDRALRHARQALCLCPLQGKAYTYLAELCFLDGSGTSCKKACVEQAVRVRPFDGAVLYAAATEAWLDGDTAQWLDYLHRAFRSGRAQQRQLIEDLVSHSSPEGVEPMIDFIIAQFQPDVVGLRFLHASCLRRVGPERLVALRRYYAQAAEAEARTLSRERAAAAWLEAQRLYAELYDAPQALDCARSALACDPNSYEVRYALASCLIEQELFDEAEPHLRWCLQRKPDSAELESKFKAALKGRLDRPHRTAGDATRTLR